MCTILFFIVVRYDSGMLHNQNIASVERIEQFLALKEEEITVPEGEPDSEGASYIEFRNVAFGYAGQNKVLKNFDLKLEEKDSVGPALPAAENPPCVSF